MNGTTIRSVRQKGLDSPSPTQAKMKSAYVFSHVVSYEKNLLLDPFRKSVFVVFLILSLFWSTRLEDEIIAAGTDIPPSSPWLQALVRRTCKLWAI